MPFWAMFLIQTAIKIGLPELEKHMAPVTADLFEKILTAIKNADNPSQTVADLHDHFGTFVANAPDTKQL